MLKQTDYFHSIPIARGVTWIEDLTNVFCYLIEGSERALLIDTGCGVGDIAAYVEALTDKPFDVVLTHVHPDHSGGVYSFKNEKIYVPEADIPALDGDDNCYEARRNFLMMNNGGQVPCPDEAILRCRPVEVEPLKDHQIFDLGDRTLEAIRIPGHTKGSTAYLDRTNRMIFLGDGANQNTLLSCENSLTVETYRRSLLKLKEYEADYDTAFICHGAPVIRNCVVDDLLELCNEVMAGKNVGTPVKNFNPHGDALQARPTDPQCNRLDGQVGDLVYRPCRIFD